jgi:hypothetical protein
MPRAAASSNYTLDCRSGIRSRAADGRAFPGRRARIAVLEGWAFSASYTWALARGMMTRAARLMGLGNDQPVSDREVAPSAWRGLCGYTRLCP